MGLKREDISETLILQNKRVLKQLEMKSAINKITDILDAKNRRLKKQKNKLVIWKLNKKEKEELYKIRLRELIILTFILYKSQKRRKGGRKFEEIIVESFPHLGKETDTGSRRHSEFPSKSTKQANTKTYCN